MAVYERVGRVFPPCGRGVPSVHRCAILTIRSIPGIVGVLRYVLPSDQVCEARTSTPITRDHPLTGDYSYIQ